MFSLETYNPAILASYSEINLSGLHREQWIGMPNAPQTTYFSANTPFVFDGKKYAAGIQFFNDNAGIFSTQNVNLQLAYKLSVYDADLFLGSNLGFVNQTIHGDSVRQITSEYHDINGDLAIPKQSVSDLAPDVSIGGYYKYKKISLGLSISHLFSPELQLDDYVKSYIGRVLYFNGGYEMILPNTRYILKPSFLFKSDFVSMQTDISAILERDEKYWGGLSWRYQDAVVVFLGMNFLQGVTAGLSYDISTTKIISNSAGSFEFFMRYSFGFGKRKSNNYKSVRIL